MKVVINNCYGGFSLSPAASERLNELEPNAEVNPRYGFCRSVERHDPNLIKVVEEMGKEANGSCANLKIIEIPDGLDYVIEEYDGKEWVAEKHRTWPSQDG